MAVSTDKLIPGVLPPKDEQEGIDFMHILDAFDPSALSDKVLDAFAARDPYVTAYGSETGYYYYEGVTEEVPDIPAESRLNTGRSVMRFDREELQKQTAAYEAGQAGAYKKCRAALIKCGTSGMLLRTADGKAMQQVGSRLELGTEKWSSRTVTQSCFRADIVRSGAGAGDTRIAAFLAAVLSGRAPEECLKLACAEGACCVTTYDALSGLKPLEELEERIRKGW